METVFKDTIYVKQRFKNTYLSEVAAKRRAHNMTEHFSSTLISIFSICIICVITMRLRLLSENTHSCIVYTVL